MQPWKGLSDPVGVGNSTETTHHEKPDIYSDLSGIANRTVLCREGSYRSAGLDKLLDLYGRRLPRGVGAAYQAGYTADHAPDRTDHHCHLVAGVCSKPAQSQEAMIDVTGGTCPRTYPEIPDIRCTADESGSAYAGSSHRRQS